MTLSSLFKATEVGSARPSQTLTTFGIGSLVDLPNLTVLVMGLDDWPVEHSTEIAEERLLQSARAILGSQVSRLMTPPRGKDSGRSLGSSSDENRLVGMPVAPFPRWMVCTSCRLLAPIDSGLFEPKVEFNRTDRTRYVHRCNTRGNPSLVIPARFLVACEHGHLDDFPWVEFVHGGPNPCTKPLKLYEVGASGEALDVEVKCEHCNEARRMGQAFGTGNRGYMPPCRGRRPHLRDYQSEPCTQERVKPMLQGASNLWFPMLISALSVPESSNELGRLIEENWGVLANARSIEILEAFRQIGLLKDFSTYTNKEIWEGMETRKSERETGSVTPPDDLKSPEWQVFTNPGLAVESRTFKLRTVESPEDFANCFEKIVLVEKLREVRALVGFTRIMSPRDFDGPSDLPPENRGRISRKNPTFIPASETRGEGIFFQFHEATIQKWIIRNNAYDRQFLRAHEAWRTAKNLAPPERGYPGIRYVLLHSFAHALIRQLAIECGYNSAAITERIYSRNVADGDPMAGVLIYTSAPDSEGTLGGLCALGEPAKLNRHIRRALEKMSLCASDPLCAEHPVGEADKLHGSSCHACSFLPETSCERGNKYLDRAVLVPTVERDDLAFFRVDG